MMLTTYEMKDHLDSIDWVVESQVEDTGFGRIQITLKVKESVYIMKIMSEDFDINTVFNEWRFRSVPAGTSVNVYVMLIPDEGVYDGTTIS